jgi:hypothetical protein
MCVCPQLPTANANNRIFQDDVSLSDPTSTLSCGVRIVTSIGTIFATPKWQIRRLPMLTPSPYRNCKGAGSVAPSTSPSRMLPLYHMKIRSICPGPSHQHQETFGKSGARRIVPGQYLATNPKGRAVMIAAMEKSKLVYVLNRDAAANLTISSLWKRIGTVLLSITSLASMSASRTRCSLPWKSTMWRLTKIQQERQPPMLARYVFGLYFQDQV